MPSSKQKKGFAGETVAAKFLQKKGYVILERNYRYRKAEVDLIVLSPRIEGQVAAELVFVEVKWRRDRLFAAPESAVGFKKRRLLVFAAEAYMHDRKMTQTFCRFDVIALSGLPPRLEIEHIEAAFVG